MSLRYFIEMAVYGCQVVVFQFYISEYNSDTHILHRELEEFHTLPSGEEKELLREDMIYEVHRVVTELDDARYISWIAYAFLANLILTSIFVSLTKRKRVIRNTNILDILIAVLVTLW